LIIKVLGSAAGGGFPQWNCNARLSRLAWDQAEGAQRRTQSSIAASADGKRWTVFNASPDIRQQIEKTRELQPHFQGPLRHSPIEAVVLTNADVDHIAGLLSLRERQAFTLYAADRVLETLKANSIFSVLAEDVVKRRQLPLWGGPLHLMGPSGPLGLVVEPFAVSGKVALYLEDAAKGNFGSEDGDTIGCRISAESSGANVFYIPGCAKPDEAILSRVEGADCLLFDGTVFTDTEMADAGVGEKTGRRMGHVPISGEGGSLHAFDHARIKRKIYIHINTTNPILEPGSEAERAVRSAGWDIAYDGMTIDL
jgi:pyrroloquinoline quinone biosynthesis protein B